MVRSGLLTALLVSLLVPFAAPTARAQTGDSNQLGISGMLAMVPAALRDLEDEEDVADFYSEITYAGFATQLASLGIDAPQDMSDGAGISKWRAAVAPLSIPPQLARSSGRPEDQAAWKAALGFAPFQIDEALGVGLPPAELLLLRGRFDATTVEAALQASGFQAIGDTIFHLDRVDLGSPAGKAVSPGMRYAAILPEGTLLFAGLEEIARGVVEFDAGTGDDLAAVPLIAPLLVSAPDLASAVIVPGVRFAGGSLSPFDLNVDPDDLAATIEAAATEAATEQSLPPVVMALFGITPGGPFWPNFLATPIPLQPGQASARFVVGLLFGSETDAESAVPVLDERLATETRGPDGDAYAQIFPERTVAVSETEPAVVEISLMFGPDVYPRVWVLLLQDTLTGLSGFLRWG